MSEAQAQAQEQAGAADAGQEAQTHDQRLDSIYTQAAEELFQEQKAAADAEFPTDQRPEAKAAEPEQRLEQPKTADAAERLKAAELRTKGKRELRRLQQEAAEAKRERDELQVIIKNAKQDPDAAITELLRRAGVTAKEWNESLSGKKDADPMVEVRQAIEELRQAREQDAKERQELQAQAQESAIKQEVLGTLKAGGKRWTLVSKTSAPDEVVAAVKHAYLQHYEDTGEQTTAEDILDHFERELRADALQKMEDAEVREALGLGAPQKQAQTSKTGEHRRPTTLTNETIASPSGAKQKRLTLDEEYLDAAEEIARQWA